ncbi:hypothetical protein N1030_11395 [Desulfovibrio mangrovi]|uniref:hypothetical protein n=1 Tax=Desulfovibrio mangrovi TaxID=2976983 RepID=UPI0022485957|nr:hypothetical protein [Desulfovibrio mangrovi]UZP66225.1 hypothetical protein N1030_11395 [Desulfovibrio mangrovi]
MSPKDTLDFDAEDDIIELTDIVEKGTPPAADETADDLFDAGGGEVDFEKELEDLFSDDADTVAPQQAGKGAGDGLDFESDLDDLLGSLDSDGESQAASPAKSDSGDDDFSAELDDLLNAQDAPAAPSPDEDDFDADLDALLGDLDTPAAKAPKAAPAAAASDEDDLLSELGLAPAKPAAPTADSDADIDFSELDALIEDMEVPKSGKPQAPQEDDGLPDLSDLDSLLEEAAAGEAVLSAPEGTAPADDMEDMDALFDSLTGPGAEIAVPAAGVTDEGLGDDIDLDSLLDEASASAEAPASGDGGDADDIESLLADLDSVPAPKPAAPLAFDPNESLESPDMGELDALLDSLGAATDEELPAAAEAEIPDLDDILGEAAATPSMEEPAEIPAGDDAEAEISLDDLDALLDGTDDAQEADIDAAGFMEPEETAEEPSATVTDEENLDELISGDVPFEADIDAMLQDVEELPAEEAAISAAAAGLTDDIMGDIGDSADETELDMTVLDEALEGTAEGVEHEAPDLATLSERIAALERMLSPAEEHVEDIVARKIAEAAAEDEARIIHDTPSTITTAVEEALAEDGPIMTRIATMIEDKLNERLAELERSVFTHKDWTVNSRELKEDMKGSIERAAAKAAADIIREELANLLGEE